MHLFIVMVCIGSRASCAPRKQLSPGWTARPCREARSRSCRSPSGSTSHPTAVRNAHRMLPMRRPPAREQLGPEASAAPSTVRSPRTTRQLGSLHPLSSPRALYKVLGCSIPVTLLSPSRLPSSSCPSPPTRPWAHARLGHASQVFPSLRSRAGTSAW